LRLGEQIRSITSNILNPWLQWLVTGVVSEPASCPCRSTFCIRLWWPLSKLVALAVFCDGCYGAVMHNNHLTLFIYFSFLLLLGLTQATLF
jgi:hypothetical protein